MQQREEKQLDLFLENSLVKLSDLKKTIAHMIQKIGKFGRLSENYFYFNYLIILEYEHQTINWPAFLDNFALISGHVSHRKIHIVRSTLEFNFTARRTFKATFPRIHTANLPIHSSTTPAQP